MGREGNQPSTSSSGGRVKGRREGRLLPSASNHRTWVRGGTISKGVLVAEGSEGP